MSLDTDEAGGPPAPVLGQNSHWSGLLVWLVPLIAALVGLGLAVRSYMSAGPEITISFHTAEGLVAGQTEVKYKEVVVGRVTAIELDDHYAKVIVTVKLSKSAEPLAVDNTRFWVVRPRADLGGISGIGTLLSGAYVGVDVGDSTKARRHFIGEEVPPPVTSDREGTRYVIESDDLGSLSIGSPLYYRHIPVGRVVGFNLRDDGRGVVIQVFVDAPYDRFVTEDARFWNASGVDITVGAGGLKLNTQSLLTLIAGGIAFRSFADDGEVALAAPAARFELYKDMDTALSPPAGRPETVYMRFNQSTRGLEIGAPIDFRGIALGSVKEISLEFDPRSQRFVADVRAEVFPRRLGHALTTLTAMAASGDDEPLAVDSIINGMIERGLRAQLRTGNIITGQLYVALDFLPDKPNPVRGERGRIEIPTVAGSLEQIQTQVLEIVSKLNGIPFDEIGSSLKDTLVAANDLLRQLDGELAPEAQQLLEEVRSTLDGVNSTLLQPDAPLQLETRQTFDEVERASRSLRALSDYLMRHPESLLKGRAEGEVPEN